MVVKPTIYLGDFILIPHENWSRRPYLGNPGSATDYDLVLQICGDVDDEIRTCLTGLVGPPTVSIYLKFESCSSVGYGGFDCSHYKVGLQSLQINFTATPDSGGGGGFDCSHCKVGLQSLQINFTATPDSGGGGFDCSHCKVGLQSLQISTSLQLLILGGGDLTAVTAKLDSSHCRSTSLQPKFKPLFRGGEWTPPQTFRA